MLTKEAFNALLKTLEEPPEHVKFIFATTEAEKVPPTILSRCQRFDFRNIPTRRIAEHLASLCEAEHVPADGDALFRVARAAAGSMRDALSLLDQLLAGGERITDEEVIRVLGTPPDERTLAIVGAIADSDAAAALGELAGVLEAGVPLTSVADALGDAFRNMMIASTCGADSPLIELPETQKQAVGELARRFSVPSLVQAVGICQHAARGVRGSSVSRALLEAAVVRLAEAEKFVDAQSLIERLESIAAGQGGGATAEKKKPPLKTPGARPSADAQAGPATSRPPGTGGASKGAPSSEPQNNTPKPTMVPLSTDEKRRIYDDPAVKEVLDLFGGDVVDMRRLASTTRAEDEAETDGVDRNTEAAD
jgi:DNA polymerase-3 subunit gamma/tau